MLVWSWSVEQVSSMLFFGGAETDGVDDGEALADSEALADGAALTLLGVAAAAVDCGSGVDPLAQPVTNNVTVAIPGISSRLMA
ncbi:hypothetical protein [Actinoplanes sp. NPDC048796]|uniref:hypothetical protein n=1 Tax=unclassified Actinoplanes TaxID=2626549 RepID=UPI0033E6A95F